MVNVEQITSRLSMMPDQALQQYAMMHKDDPYILSLAVSESNRRKQMRAASAPEAQNQTKVADQELANMLPERQGIGSLPANMEFADGGIVAFADGGDVEHYQVGGSTYETPYDRRNRLLREQAAAQTVYADESSTPDFIAGDGGYYAKPLEAEARSGSPILQRFVDWAGRNVERDPETGEVVRKSQAPTPISSVNDTYNPATATRRADFATATSPASATASTAASGIARLPGAAGAPTVGGDMVSRAKKTASEIYDTTGIDKLLQEKQGLVDARAAELRKGLESRPTEKAYLGLEQSLKKEEAAEAGEKDRATGMAIFKAGLAMMSGSSPYALQNIGKGAMVGAEEYGSAIKEFKKAAKDRQKLMAEIDEKRRLQSIGDWEAVQSVDAKIADLQMGIKDKMIDATVKTTGVKAELAGGLIGKEMDRQTQIAVKGMPSYSDAQEQRLINMWLKDNPGKNEIDARTVLGLGLGGRQAGASDRIRGYQTILNDMTATDEEKADARAKLRALIAGQQAGAGDATGPKIGEIKQGYRFKGGDPANQANWEKVK